MAKAAGGRLKRRGMVNRKKIVAERANKIKIRGVSIGFINFEFIEEP